MDFVKFLFFLLINYGFSLKNLKFRVVLLVPCVVAESKWENF